MKANEIFLQIIGTLLLLIGTVWVIAVAGSFVWIIGSKTVQWVISLLA